LSVLVEKPKKVYVERTLRILHVSDMHCATDSLAKVLMREEYDLVIATGDFECVDTAEVLARARGEVYAVTGNMDNPAIYRKLNNMGILIDGKIVIYEDLAIGGIGGLDFKGSMSRLEKELKEFNKIDILVTHHPPKGILDEPRPGYHIGLEDLKKLVGLVNPKLHLFGHVHEEQGHVVKGGTVYVNSGPLIQGYYTVIIYSSNITVHKRKI